jgi:vacuolar-type H+-ATPase subunit H
MRARITFLAGLAVGFVAGTRAGRERYEQMVKFSRKVAENPAVQKATRTAGSKAAELSKAAGQKATELSKAAGQKAAEQMPKVAETAKNSASKVRDRIPGRNSGDADTITANGTRPGD